MERSQIVESRLFRGRLPRIIEEDENRLSFLNFYRAKIVEISQTDGDPMQKIALSLLKKCDPDFLDLEKKLTTHNRFENFFNLTDDEKTLFIKITKGFLSKNRYLRGEKRQLIYLRNERSNNDTINYDVINYENVEKVVNGTYFLDLNVIKIGANYIGEEYSYKSHAYEILLRIKFMKTDVQKTVKRLENYSEFNIGSSYKPCYEIISLSGTTQKVIAKINGLPFVMGFKAPHIERFPLFYINGDINVNEGLSLGFIDRIDAEKYADFLTEYKYNIDLYNGKNVWDLNQTLEKIDTAKNMLKESEEMRVNAEKILAEFRRT